MLEVAFLAAHLLGFLSTESQNRLLDLVTTKAARVLGVRDHAIAAGHVADLAVHDAERVVDVLRAHAAPRWVIGHGRVVADTTVDSRLSVGS
jgi:cytosine deaminase